jgi:hypothetical protein
MTIQQAPGRANVYWSNQFQFTGGDVGGYTGMQTHRDGGGMFLYSLWNSTDWKASGCLNVSGGNSATGTAILLYTCTGGNNQNWVHSENGSVRALFSCLDASATQPGAVILYGCHGGANQSWTTQADGTLRNASSGLCLTAPASIGNAVQATTCTGASNQRWTLPQ